MISRLLLKRPTTLSDLEKLDLLSSTFFSILLPTLQFPG
jgi:hypothetical protein